MEPKKNPDLEVGRNSSLYFAVGLNLMLLLAWTLLEHKTYIKSDSSSQKLSLDEEFVEEIPITEQILLAPPPPPPLSSPEEIQVVEDISEIEESNFESLETTQDEVITYKDVEIDEVNVIEVEEDIEVPFSVVEKVPVFPGCKGSNQELIKCFEENIYRHIKENFKYPEDASDKNQQGKVYIMFTIDTDGCVANMRTRGPYKILESEAQRIISNLPQMEPAKQRGRAVKVTYSLPIFFKLTE